MKNETLGSNSSRGRGHASGPQPVVHLIAHANTEAGTDTAKPRSQVQATCSAASAHLSAHADKAAVRIACQQLLHRHEPLYFTVGTCLLAAIVAIAAGAPCLLPHAFLLFLIVALPWRAVSFIRRRWVFFLVDYCYFANLIVAAYLLAPPVWLAHPAPAWPWPKEHAAALGSGSAASGACGITPDLAPAPTRPSSSSLDTSLQAAVYVLAEGPLAAALLAWRCAWVLNSASHTISVLIHLLPGLAMFSRRYMWPQPLALAATAAVAAADGSCPMPASAPPPSSLGYVLQQALQLPGQSMDDSSGSSSCVGAAAPCPTASGPPHTPSSPWLWLCAVPLAIYLTWQLLYWVIVQVLFRSRIRSGGYDTSYSALSRRASRADSVLHRLVRRGSAARRVTMYGALQLAFSVTTGALAVATYYSFALALAWQVVKFVAPLYFGAHYSTHKATEDAVLRGMQLARSAAAAASTGSSGSGGSGGGGSASSCPDGKRSRTKTHG